MKIQVTVKDPDTLHDAVDEAVEEAISNDPKFSGLDEEEKDDIADKRAAKIREQIVEKWVEYGEYYRIEFDTETGTATMLPRS